MKEIVIVSGCRTAVGSFGGSLRDMSVVDLGSIVIKEALKRTGLRPVTGEERLQIQPDVFKGKGLVELEKKHYDWDESLRPVQIDEVIMGNVLQGGQGQNTARQAAIHAGIPKETPVTTVNKICASGLKAITLGAQSIMAGENEIVIAGGMEAMSHCPYVLPKARWGYRMDVSSRGELVDLMVFDGLWEIFYGFHMGNTAEEIAITYNISREEMDKIGYDSHMRARKAIADGIFKEEIIPVSVPQRRGPPIIFDTDERPMDTSPEKMAKLPPAFRPDGKVTAGNASGINDASSAVVLMTREKAKELGLEPFVTIKAWASAGIDPKYMGLGPIPAVRKVLKNTELTIDDMDVIELNEAFASQTIACMRELGMSWDKINLHGSGISIGHPIGCTGARITVATMYDMKHRNLHRGLITMCIGGGQGMAMIVERP
jgi:acetyl-CoA C-acetyltransferase